MRLSAPRVAHAPSGPSVTTNGVPMETERKDGIARPSFEIGSLRCKDCGQKVIAVTSEGLSPATHRAVMEAAQAILSDATCGRCDIPKRTRKTATADTEAV